MLAILPCERGRKEDFWGCGMMFSIIPHSKPPLFGQMSALKLKRESQRQWPAAVNPFVANFEVGVKLFSNDQRAFAKKRCGGLRGSLPHLQVLQD